MGKLGLTVQPLNGPISTRIIKETQRNFSNKDGVTKSGKINIIQALLFKTTTIFPAASP